LINYFVYMPAPKYPLPSYLAGTTSQDHYNKWLDRKALALFLRDKRRKRPYALAATRQLYKQKLHDTVMANASVDPFTGDALRWDLIHKWDPKKNKGHGNFKKEFYMLPTVDHRYPDGNVIDFEICSWLINSCKSDQTPEEFITMCRTIVAYRKLHPSSLSLHPFPGRDPQFYFLPPFLEGICTEAVYRKWLHARAHQLYMRDRNQGRPYALAASNALYQHVIHSAACAAGLLDPYTGERMRWDLISTWKSTKGKDFSDAYDKEYYLLPTVDHVDPFGDKLEFEICSWRINACKSGLTPEEFVEVCKKVTERRAVR
jgi:hypothetical protein